MKEQLDRIEQKLDLLLEKKKRKPRKKIIEYPNNFENLWHRYPDRSGSNPKIAAYRAWCARIQDGVEPEVIARGLERYRTYCEEMGLIGTTFVMQASRFFGPGEEYLNDWSYEERPPKNDEDYINWAALRGYHPKPGETMNQFRARVE